MDIKGIISISGLPGLFKVVAQTKTGIIVESLSDKKRIPVYSSQKVSALEDVSIYSTGEDVPLKDVFQKIYDKESGKECISHKQLDAELKAYFKSAFAEYDEERVYVSDIKKVLMWYNVLQKEGLLDKEEEKDEDGKVKLGLDDESKKIAKHSLKDTTAKPIKTAGTKVKTQGVRKTGAA